MWMTRYNVYFMSLVLKSYDITRRSQNKRVFIIICVLHRTDCTVVLLISECHQYNYSFFLVESTGYICLLNKTLSRCVIKIIDIYTEMLYLRQIYAGIVCHNELF